MLLLALSLTSIGCPRREAAGGQKATVSAKIVELVGRLSDPEEKVADAAIKEIDRLGRDGFSAEDGAFILRAATRSYPPPKIKVPMFETPGRLVRATLDKPRVEYIAVVKEIYPKLDATARTDALDLLTRMSERAGAVAFMGLVRTQPLPELRTAVLQRDPRYPDVYFPELLDYAKGEHASDIYLLCLAFADAKLLQPAQLAPHAGPLLARAASLRDQLLPLQSQKSNGWMWSETYAGPREDASVVLDVLGYFPTPAVEVELVRALGYADPRLQFFAATSLLRLGKSVPPETLTAIAASAEMRNWLYDRLDKMGKAAAFPAKWKTQQALAESDMVRWLAYPTELGRPPDEIELMKVVSVDAGDDGTLDCYLFRFRTHPPHWAAKDGWMAGISGPFRRKDAPTTSSMGDTFSKFEPWSSKTPEQHVAEIQKLMDEWREHAAEKRAE
jgi:hypothetical protein